MKLKEKVDNSDILSEKDLKLALKVFGLLVKWCADSNSHCSKTNKEVFFTKRELDYESNNSLQDLRRKTR